MPNLELDVTADAAQAVTALGSVGDAARGMATDVDAAASSADAAVGKMDGLAGSADNLDSKASQATGAFGALAGGLEAAGFEGAAAGLQGVALATDFASGAGGLFNLVLESQAAQFLIQKARMAASVIATGAQATATGIATAAQWAWNAAMTANPIGLVIAALALVAGALILAYQKVGPFRDAVDAAVDFITPALDLVSQGLDTVIGWISDAAKAFPGIQSAAEAALTPVTTAIGAVSSAVETAIGWVQSLIGWIDKIDFPDKPGWLGGRSVFVPGGGFDPTAQGGTPFPILTDPGQSGDLVIKLTVEPPGDKDDATKKMVEAMREYFARQGQTLRLT